MLKLQISEKLSQEFATVTALWDSVGKTKRVDALVLCWVKYEKQLRRLFCFLVFQHPKITDECVEAVVALFAKSRDLNPELFIKAIEALGVKTIPELLGERHADLAREIFRIKGIRNKLIHGQVSSKNITSKQLERDVLWIVEWVDHLATGADHAYGYDGLKRNTFRNAKTVERIAVEKYPFTTPTELSAWLFCLAKKQKSGG